MKNYKQYYFPGIIHLPIFIAYIWNCSVVAISGSFNANGWTYSQYNAIKFFPFVLFPILFCYVFSFVPLLYCIVVDVSDTGH